MIAARGYRRRDLDLRLERAIDRLAGGPLVALLGLALTRAREVGPPEPGVVRRILLMKLHGVGNLVMMRPALCALRRRFPGAAIDLVTFRSNEGMVPGLDELSRVFLLEGANAWQIVRSSALLLGTLRRRRYDLVVDFEQFANLSAILAGLSGAPHRIGFRNPARRRHLLFTTPVAYADTAHMSRLFFRLARAAGVGADEERREPLPIRADELQEALAFERSEGLRPSDVVVVLHPGSSPNLTLRRWPEERFAALADRLAGDHGARIVLSGGPGEEDLVRRIAGTMRSPPALAAGRLSLMALAVMCGRAEFIVSNDTSLIHIASAMGTPVVGIYGPNTPFLYGPTGPDDLVFYHELPCSPCLVNTSAKLSTCRRARCVEAVSVEEVAAGIAAKYFAADGRLRPAFKRERPAGGGHP